MKHQIFISSQCTTSPIFKLMSITVWILWHFQKVPFSAHFRPIFPFPFSWGGGAPQTPSHISSFDPLGVRNNQHQKKFFAPEPIFKLSQSAPLNAICRVRPPTKKPTLGVQHAVEAGYL